MHVSHAGRYASLKHGAGGASGKQMIRWAFAVSGSPWAKLVQSVFLKALIQRLPSNIPRPLLFATTSFPVSQPVTLPDMLTQNLKWTFLNFRPSKGSFQIQITRPDMLHESPIATRV